MNKTAIIVLLVAAGLILYDIKEAANSVPGDTISEVIWRLSRHPALPFAVGFLCGHLFWQRSY